jgi:hypothetical protein
MLLNESGFTKLFDQNPPVSPTNTTWSQKIPIGDDYYVDYSVRVDANNPFDFDISTGSLTWGVFEDYKSQLTSISGITASLADDFGILGEKAQDYLNDHGFGDVTIGTGAISFSNLILSVQGLGIKEVSKINYVPYANTYDTTVSISLNENFDLDNTIGNVATALVITLAIVALLESGGIAAVASIITALGSAGLQSIAGLL